MDDADCAAALVIMRGWEWEGWSGFYEDAVFGPITRPLSDAVNTLAFEGQPAAARVILSLLANGDLVATGNCKWRAFSGEHYQNEARCQVAARRWRVLKEGLALPFGKDGRMPQVRLDVLDAWADDCEYPIAQWNWRNGAFATAQRGPGDIFDDGYSEEWFSASNIEVCPAPAHSGRVADTAPAPQPLDTVRRNGGRPPKWDWEGAMAHVAAVANTPDGLETGPGAQAAIERLIADHFTRASDDASTPCESEIRKRAKRIMDEIENLKGGLAMAA
jgi:hypothetical protein